MPSALLRSDLAFRPLDSHIRPIHATKVPSIPSYKAPLHTLHHPEYLPYKPPRKPHMTARTITVVNASGRQAASLIRVASAVGYNVRAQLRNLDGIVANEIASLPNVTVFVGELSSPDSKTNNVNVSLINTLFQGAELAFINTTFWGNEIAIGKALADAAKRANIQHYIYSSMPDHSKHNPSWPALPLWSSKAAIEQYIRQLGLPATFVYTGIYNNNFTSLPYPLFCTALQEDGSFVWQAPFHPDVKLPWLDAEHDVGPAVLQLIKDGVSKWGHMNRIALAYEMLTPKEVCRAFSRGINRPVHYIQGPIEITVKIPRGYREQLEGLERLYSLGGEDGSTQPLYFGDLKLEKSCPEEAMQLWEGYRGLEEYAREVFPLEEANNGLTWMMDDPQLAPQLQPQEEEDDEDDEDDVLTMGKRREEEWLA